MGFVVINIKLFRLFRQSSLMFRVFRNITLLQHWQRGSQRETVPEVSNTEENIYFQLSLLEDKEFH